MSGDAFARTRDMDEHVQNGLTIRVVTVSFNQLRWLKSCLSSMKIAIQELSNVDSASVVDHVVVDAGSSDGSREFLQRYDGHKLRLVLESDRGPADGLNKGFRQSDFDVGYFLNSDDLVMPGAFVSAVNHFHSSNAQWLISQGAKYFPDGRTQTFRVRGFSARSYALGREVVFQQGVFFRKSLWDQVGGFNVSNRVSWDGELFARFAEVARPLVVEEVMGIWRIQPLAISSSVAHKQDLEKQHDELFVSLFARSPRGRERWASGARAAVRVIRDGRVPR